MSSEILGIQNLFVTNKTNWIVSDTEAKFVAIIIILQAKLQTKSSEQ